MLERLFISYMVNYERFRMQINLSEGEHADLQGVRFIIADLLLCVWPPSARLINTDFVVLAHILNFIRIIEFRMFSTHC